MRALAYRFWAKVDKGVDSDCWTWTGTTDPHGYGTIYFNQKARKATHVVWFLTHGVWPKQWMLHSCDNPPCVNPKHLREGTHRNNVDDKVKRGRQPKGEALNRGHITDADVRAMRARYQPYKCTLKMLATEYRISTRQVWDIVHIVKWVHVE